MVDSMHPRSRSRSPMTMNPAKLALLMAIGWVLAGFTSESTPTALAAAAQDPPARSVDPAGPDDGTPSQDSTPGSNPTTPAATIQAPLLGFGINAHHIGNMPLYLDAVDRIAALGANALIVVTPMFQRRVDSTDIRFIANKCPTDKQLLDILHRAKQHGLYTTLLPIVLIEKPGEKEWRGVIKPTNWDRWWESYERFLNRFLAIAVAADVDLLSIGSELNTTESQLDRWEHLAAHARETFDGRLTYSANWDRFKKVQLWSLVDVMSVSSYFELSRDDPDASVDRLTDAWAKQRDRLLDFAAEQDRPLMLSEVGYPSLASAAAFPWNYVADDDVKADHEAQARCYQAFFNAWTAVLAAPDSHAFGFHCYHWDPYHHGQSTDTGYGVNGKPALEIIRAGFAEIAERTLSPTD